MKKIIIIEDDPMIAEIYQRKFSQSDYEVLLAESGEQALNFAKKEKVDVILSDLIMPKMDGFEVIKNIRSGGYDPNIKIIVFSNLSQKEDREKALNLGANGFVVKSDYTPSDLVKEVSRIVNNCEEAVKNEARINGTAPVIPDDQKKRILLIEDEEIFIEMFGEKLKQDGYIVEAAQNGAWGIKLALEKEFDIFVIDMIMPAMTGEEMIGKLKMEEKTKNIPIIALSASVEPQMEAKILGMGANAFYLKTQIIPSELSKKVGELLK
jgi:CheY-like chemotaxis protein